MRGAWHVVRVDWVASDLTGIPLCCTRSTRKLTIRQTPTPVKRLNVINVASPTRRADAHARTHRRPIPHEASYPPFCTIRAKLGGQHRGRGERRSGKRPRSEIRVLVPTVSRKTCCYRSTQTLFVSAPPASKRVHVPYFGPRVRVSHAKREAQKYLHHASTQG